MVSSLSALALLALLAPLCASDTQSAHAAPHRALGSRDHPGHNAHNPSYPPASAAAAAKAAAKAAAVRAAAARARGHLPSPNHPHPAALPVHRKPPPRADPTRSSAAGQAAPPNSGPTCRPGSAADLPSDVARAQAAAHHCPYGCSASKSALIKALQTRSAFGDNPVSPRLIHPSLEPAWRAHRAPAASGGLAVLLSGQVSHLP